MYSKERCVYNLENRKIDIIDLFKYILVRWKKVVGITLCFFILMTIGIFYKYQVGQSSQNISSSKEIGQTTEEGRKKAENIQKMRNQLESLEKYREDSAYMQLNASDCLIATLQYFVSAPQKENLNMVYELYINFIEQGMLKVQLEKDLGEEIKNPGELVRLENHFYEANEGSDLNKNVLSLRINVPDEELKEQITESVKKGLNNYRREMVNPLIGEHELKLISESSYSEFDEEVFTKQEIVEKKINDIKIQLTSLESQLTVDEKKISDAEEKVVEESGGDSFPYKSVILALLISFFAASGILCCCYFAFVYCKLKNKEELLEIFDIPYIVVKKGEDGKLDKETIKKEFRLFCQARKVTNVFLSCLENVANQKELCGILSEIVEVDVRIGESIHNNVDTLESAKKCENMFLVVKTYATSYNTIMDILRVSECYGIKVQGFIVVD